MDKKELKSIIEALLFIWGEPLTIDDISEVVGVKTNDLEKIINEMIDEFDYYRRGIRIIKINKSYQLCTRKEHYKWISKLCTPKTNKGLSNAALETLAIIAYKQPITRLDIESIRGVKCSKSLNTLMEKDLIKELGRLEKPGKPIVYGTTEYFLKYFGLTSLNDLPETKEYSRSDLEEQ